MNRLYLYSFVRISGQRGKIIGRTSECDIIFQADPANLFFLVVAGIASLRLKYKKTLPPFSRAFFCLFVFHSSNMRLTTPALTTALRGAASSTRFTAQRQGLGSIRTYATEPEKKKGGNGLLMLTLLGLGAAGGLYYNQNKHTVAPVSAAAGAATAAAADKKEAQRAFDPKEFRAYKLQTVEPINHNTKLFRFALPENTVADLPVASCVITRYPITKKDGTPGFVIRPYTPTSAGDAEGYVDFIVKVYPDGKMSKHIHDMKIGDELEIKGPIPKFNWESSNVENVGMIAGGTGITPMLQIIRKVFEKSADSKTKITLLFANQTEEDILLKNELDTIAKEHPEQFKVVYAVEKPSEKFDGVKGYVTSDVIKQHLPSPDTDKAMIFVCGPDPMLAAFAGPKNKDKSQGEVSGILKELGYSEKNVYKF
ncbi:uncharacterized protein BYT42DRAFT_577860 [Radiomyces spectabilis]|uniref:uncharacterized protein n=1 Tax=Radiomyces spectabilis TaxID=64574 RepID=UPI002220C3E6|nr:uncharacterized protein BYT42DRAFT_577860 [Radiomyces spectabilis]KAI8372745.1 hypothetical protein BYT42DRAFT_577860 [Radiomyces spectabilis]